MKILITGALGHIGSSLIRSLHKIHNIKSIYILDNLISQRYNSLFDLPNNKFFFINEDLSKIKISSLPKTELVVHLAAKTDAAQSHKFENEFYSNNLAATKNIIKYCKKTNAKLIFASSTSVYGPQSNVVNENADKKELNPQSPYAEVKLIEEKLIKSKLNKKKYIILRLGTIYGFSNGIRFHTAVNKFCFQSSMNQPLTVWKTALHQKRPYLNLNDFNRLIIHIIQNKVKNNEIYNAVSKNMTVNDILKNIKKIHKVKIKFVNHPIMNQMSYEVSSKKIRDTNFIFYPNILSSIKKTLKKLKNIKN